jgi:hypothetical protein
VAALAVGLAILAMYITGTFHPPAEINPRPVISDNLPFSFFAARPPMARRGLVLNKP